MAAGIERVEAELAARIDEFRAGGDPARILADETLTLLIALVRAAGKQVSTSTSVMATFGWGWWCRHLASVSVGTGADEADDVNLDQAREVFYVVELLDVTQVPPELRHPLPADPEDDTSVLLDRARRLIATGSWAEAAAFAYAAIHATPQESSARTAVLTQAGFLLYAAFLCGANPSYLDRAAAVFRMAADDSDPGDPFLAKLYVGIARVAEQQYRLRGDPRDLEHSIGSWRMAVTQYPAGSEDRAAAAAELSTALLAGYGLSRDKDLVLEAVVHARQAVQSAVSGPERTGRHWHLGKALIASHTVTHALADVDDAITAIRETAGDLAFPHPDDLRHCLFILYRIRFCWYGRSRDIDTAIWWGEYAVQLAAPDSRWRDDDAQALALLHDLDQARGPGVPGHCQDVRDDWLVSPLRERILAFVRYDDRAGLLAPDAPSLAVTAIKRYRLDTGPTKTKQLCAIAWFFWCRHLVLPRGHEADDFRLAVDYFARLAQVDPQLVATPVARLVVMGEVDLDPGHYRTFSHMVTELRRSDVGTDIDLDATTSLLRRLLPLADDENQVRCRTILAWALAARAERRGSAEDLDEAAAMLGDLAADAPTAAPDRALYLGGLAARLRAGSSTAAR